MAEKSVVITGANSDLGRALVRFIVENTRWPVYALVSHRSTGKIPELTAPNVTVFRSNLTEELPGELLNVFKHSRAIIHLAWARYLALDKACTLNRRMIEPLIASVAEPSDVFFISTVAASPTALSIYGQSKFALARYVAQRGGVVVACGLVMDDPPRGPYGLLLRWVKKLPIRARFMGQEPLIYPIAIGDVCRRLVQAVDAKVPGGTYKLCGSPIGLNQFLAQIEQRYLRRRLPVPMNAHALLTIALRLPLISGPLIDKVLTFLQKDEGYLASLPELPKALLNNARPTGTFEI